MLGIHNRLLAPLDPKFRQQHCDMLVGGRAMSSINNFKTVLACCHEVLACKQLFAVNHS